MRLAFTDGEMSNLQADFGQLLCACVLEYNPKRGENPWTNLRTFTLRDYTRTRWDDKSLAREWRDALEGYDAILTWNGIKFDIPFLETRCRRWNLRGPKVPSHKDVLYTSRYKLRLASNALDSVAQHLKIHEKYGIRKTRMEPERWTRAMGGHRQSYNYIIAHCQLDVKVLAAVYNELKHLIPIFQKA